MGVASTGPTSAACSSLRSNLEVSSAGQGRDGQDREADLVFEHRDESVELGAASGDQDTRDRQPAGQRCEVLDRVPDLADQFVHADLGGALGCLHLGVSSPIRRLTAFGVGNRDVESG